MKRLILGLSACIVAASLAVASAAPARAAGAPIVMKLATGTLNDSQHEWLKRFAVEIQRDTHGRIVAQVYPSGQLGSVPRMVELLQFGSIQAMTLPLDFMQGIDPRFQLMDAPGLFETFAQANATLDDPRIQALYLNMARSKGITGLQMFSEGPLTTVTRRLATGYPDLKGWKIRTLAGAMQRGEMSAMGASGVPLPLDQLSPAMQQGAVDGAILNMGVANSLGLEASAKYALELRDGWPPGMAAFNTTWFEKLPPDLRKIVVADATHVNREVQIWADQFLTQQAKTWTTAGGQITVPTAAERAAFVKLVLPVAAGVAAADPQTNAAWALIAKVAATHRTAKAHE
jgi:TRAP-type transport system periplasmic protein